MLTISTYHDKELVASLERSDQRAFAEIYRRYWDKLLAIAYKHTQDKSAAEELVQDVFISLWDRRGEVEIKSLNNYLAVAIKFAVFKYISRTRRHAEIERIHYNSGNANFDEEQINARFLKEYIDGVVELLPEKCRLVFRYSREEYKSNAEIAAQMSISEKAVEAHITRAIKTLRANLKKAGISMFFSFIFLIIR